MRTNAFEKIYRQHYPAVYRYALSLARDTHLAEDLTQETFVKAMLSLDAGRDSMAAWLHVVCRNLWYDQCRRDKRLQFMGGEALEKLLGDTGSNEAEPLGGLLQRIDRLPPAMREAVILFYHSGLSTKEIARVQNTTSGAVRTMLYRARIRLKTIWEDEQDEF